jgi:hypothetical protein
MTKKVLTILNAILFFLCVLNLDVLNAQTYTSISIKKFGAKGDGKTNDHLAFQKASEYINKAGKNIKLIIPKGKYIVGVQNPSTTVYLAGSTALAISNCSNIIIEGNKAAKIIYADGLRFGSFDPDTKQAFKPSGEFYDRRYSAQIGNCISIDKCNNIVVKNFIADGNLDKLDIGGAYGDKGIQLPHYGLYISNSAGIKIENCEFNRFACDGAVIYGSEGFNLINSKFEYNGRQGLSWVGGKKLRAINCSFSYTGSGKLSSSPGAGVDIECEVSGTISDGNFENCTFVDNSGPAFLAESGSSRDVVLTNCTFWGLRNWSIWVKKPNFTFKSCKIYGSFVHGFNTTSEAEATKFYDCIFEDKPLNGKQPYGSYLAEVDSKKLMIFENCSFTTNKQKAIWYHGLANNTNEQAAFRNCTFNVKNSNLADGDFFALIRYAQLDNTKFNYYFPTKKKYYLEGNVNNSNSRNSEIKQLNK